MNNKVILVLVDGMASYSIKECPHPFLKQLLKSSISNLDSTTVMPSVTLPCHMSLFHSATPQRHGILTNTYVPQVRPIEGLVEQLKKFNKNSAFFYNWEELRDLSRPGNLACSLYISQYKYSGADNLVTDNAIQYIQEFNPDFSFIYLGELDETGHKYGWESAEFKQKLYDAWSCIERLYQSYGSDCKFVVTADHGGHDLCHGTDDPRDMHIPIIISGYKAEDASAKLSTANIIDIAPTITSIMGVEANEYWQGVSLL